MALVISNGNNCWIYTRKLGLIVVQLIPAGITVLKPLFWLLKKGQERNLTWKNSTSFEILWIQCHYHCWNKYCDKVFNQDWVNVQLLAESAQIWQVKYQFCCRFLFNSLLKPQELEKLYSRLLCFWPWVDHKHRHINCFLTAMSSDGITTASIHEQNFLDAISI